MEKGFYHPARGYWQAIGPVSEHILATYPEGTIEVPLRPVGDFEWDGSAWVPVPPIPPSQEEQEANRQAAYIQEADPLFFEWQAGEGTEQAWLEKREEIRQRFPYPEE